MTEKGQPCPTCGRPGVSSPRLRRSFDKEFIDWSEVGPLTDEGISGLRASDALRSVARGKIELQHLRGEITTHELEIALSDLARLEELLDHGVLTEREFQLLADHVGEQLR